MPGTVQPPLCGSSSERGASCMLRPAHEYERTALTSEFAARTTKYIAVSKVNILPALVVR